MVILKKPLYHLRDRADPFVILMSARKITHGKHNGTTNQLIPPCPEYVKLRPGMIANANITIGKPNVPVTSGQKLGSELLLRFILVALVCTDCFLRLKPRTDLTF